VEDMHLTAVTKECPEKVSWVNHCPADNQIEDLLNTSLERNRCANMLVRSQNCFTL
jgi:hypothetical protein